MYGPVGHGTVAAIPDGFDKFTGVSKDEMDKRLSEIVVDSNARARILARVLAEGQPGKCKHRSSSTPL